MPWAHSWMLSNRFHSAFLPYNVRRPSCDAAFAARIRAVVTSMNTDKAFRNKLQFKFVQITATVELMMGKMSANWAQCQAEEQKPSCSSLREPLQGDPPSPLVGLWQAWSPRHWLKSAVASVVILLRFPPQPHALHPTHGQLGSSSSAPGFCLLAAPGAGALILCPPAQKPWISILPPCLLPFAGTDCHSGLFQELLDASLVPCRRKSRAEWGIRQQPPSVPIGATALNWPREHCGCSSNGKVQTNPGGWAWIWGRCLKRVTKESQHTNIQQPR